jgi:hypothetical protein
MWEIILDSCISASLRTAPRPQYGSGFSLISSKEKLLESIFKIELYTEKEGRGFYPNIRFLSRGYTMSQPTNHNVNPHHSNYLKSHIIGDAVL